MNIFDFFKSKKQCHHDKISPFDEVAYCPDCGALVENQWYITRCTCCGIKLKAIYKNGEVIPEEKFCHNCGGQKFIAEKVSKINCIDINYAIPVKTVITPHIDEMTQSWINFEEKFNPKLIGQT